MFLRSRCISQHLAVFCLWENKHLRLLHDLGGNVSLFFVAPLDTHIFARYVLLPCGVVTIKLHQANAFAILALICLALGN